VVSARPAAALPWLTLRASGYERIATSLAFVGLHESRSYMPRQKLTNEGGSWPTTSTNIDAQGKAGFLELAAMPEAAL
jgi:hypothetical protein